MKKYIIPALAIVALMASCEKEMDTSVPDRDSNKVSIRATIDNEATKTNYDMEESSAVFYWTGVEEIGRLYYSSYFQEQTYTSLTSADNKETSLVFSGFQDGTSTNYALYPRWTGEGQPGIGWRSNPLDLYICPTLEYNSTDPIKGIIPMLGKLNNGEFVFTPLSAVIAVTVKNLPSSARSISLTSDTKRLSGYYRVSSNPTQDASQLDGITLGLTTTMAYYASTVADANKKIFTFSSGLDKGEHTFYFPVSVGEIPDLKIIVKDGTGGELQTVSYTKSITTVRGQITRFPTMDLAKATKVAVTGTSQQFYAYLSKLGPEADHVSFAVANTSADAIDAAQSSSLSISAAGEANKVEVSGDLTASGSYYLGYAVFNTSGQVIYQNSIPVYYLANEDTKVAGEYQFNAIYALTLYNRSAWVDLTQDYTYESVNRNDNRFVLEVSNDPTQGALMITDILGFNCSGTMTNKGLIEDKLLNSNNKLNGTYGAGAPLYGSYNPSNKQITFNTKDKVFFTLNDVKVYVRQYWGDQATIRFNYSDDGTTATLAYQEYAMCFVNQNQVLSDAGSHYGGNNCEVYMNGNTTGYGLFSLSKTL